MERGQRHTEEYRRETQTLGSTGKIEMHEEFQNNNNAEAKESSRLKTDVISENVEQILQKYKDSGLSAAAREEGFQPTEEQKHKAQEIVNELSEQLQAVIDIFPKEQQWKINMLGTSRNGVPRYFESDEVKLSPTEKAQFLVKEIQGVARFIAEKNQVEYTDQKFELDPKLLENIQEQHVVETEIAETSAQLIKRDITLKKIGYSLDMYTETLESAQDDEEKKLYSAIVQDRFKRKQKNYENELAKVDAIVEEKIEDTPFEIDREKEMEFQIKQLVHPDEKLDDLDNLIEHYTNQVKKIAQLQTAQKRMTKEPPSEIFYE